MFCVFRSFLLSVALDVHAVQQLRFHIAFGDGARHLHKAVGKSAFTVVDVRYYAKVSCILLRQVVLLRAVGLRCVAVVMTGYLCQTDFGANFYR